MASALLIVPDFALILLGFALRQGAFFGDRFWSELERLVYFVLFPALLFNALARTPIEPGAAGPLLATGLSAMAFGMLLGLPARRLFRMPAGVFASRYQCAFRFNTYLGIALAGKLHGEAGIAAMGLVAGAMVPFANLASVWMLARQGNHRLWRELARNPLILATLAGALFNLSGAPYPALAGQFLGRLAEASITLGLLAVGAGLRLGAAGGERLASAYFIGVKQIAMPGAALAVAGLLGLTGVQRDIALLFAALPTASSAYILTVRMGGDGVGVAWIVSAGTLCATITLSAWLALLH